jgi:hypothetical protein
MHENREISCTSCSKEQDRSAKAINRTADMHVQEKSDCAVIPVNRPNKEAQACAEAGEGRSLPRSPSSDWSASSAHRQHHRLSPPRKKTQQHFPARTRSLQALSFSTPTGYYVNLSA